MEFGRLQDPAPRHARRSKRSDADVKAMCERIAGAVAALLRVPVKVMMGHGRGARVTRARQIAMYLANVAFSIGMADVGKVFARDRSTVAYACRRIEDERDDPDFDRRLDVLERLVREDEGARDGQ